MKKLLLVVSLIATAFAVNAQNEFRPTAGKKGFTFGLQNIFQNGNSTITSSGPGRTGALLFKYYVKDDIAARFGINYTHAGTKTTDTLSNPGNEIVIKKASSTFAIQLGAQKSFGEGKLEPYLGVDLYVAKNTGHYDSTGTLKSNGNSNEIKSKNGKINSNGAFSGPTSSIGLIPVVGFNYYIAKNFSIGAEFGWGLILTSGKKNAEIVSTNRTGNTVTTTTSHQNMQSKGTNFGTKGNGQIQVSILF